MPGFKYTGGKGFYVHPAISARVQRRAKAKAQKTAWSARRFARQAGYRAYQDINAMKFNQVGYRIKRPIKYHLGGSLVKRRTHVALPFMRATMGRATSKRWGHRANQLKLKRHP